MEELKDKFVIIVENTMTGKQCWWAGRYPEMREEA